MTADGDDRRASSGERLSLHADVLGAEEQARDLRARLQRTETELQRAQEDLEGERFDRERDAEWFRQALTELRTAAADAHATERTADDLRAALDEARNAITARDALLGELREELERRVRAESETLSALDALRERATVLGREAPPPPAEPPPVPAPASEPPVAVEAEPAPPDEPPAAPDAEPPAAGEPAPAAIGGRFDRRPPWPDGTAEHARAEIEWHAGYVNSQFRVVVYQPNRKRGTTAATGSNYKWLLMGEPAPDSPEFAAEVERLAAALEEAGWEMIGEGAAWFSRRYVWRHDAPAPEQLSLKPLEAFQRS
jgi:hypothetical protein